ncbi:replication initiation protein [Spirosoma agri]|uniref:Replication initiation protein n=1 Tax=Spirosoma agri TaxID=1987381 RepID=A0A6M0IPR5_9BACT|nr:replication initiation protein [Spirosoma agri]NEU70329.1 replication initiation protein [Spirosoma agri]
MIKGKGNGRKGKNSKVDHTLLYQGNSVTAARYEMSELQKNLMYTLQAAIRPDDGIDTVYTFQVREIMTDLDRDPNNGYKNLQEATKGMMQVVFEMYVNGQLIQVNPFSSAVYDYGKGTISLRVDPNMRPLLTGLTGNYTTFGKEMAMRLTGKYAKRLYEMFSQWKDVGNFRIGILDLKHRLNLYDPETQQEEYNITNFFRFVLDPAINEINQRSDLIVRFRQHKTGRKITDLTFTIKRIRIEQELYLPGIDSDTAILADRLMSRFGLRPDQRDLVLSKFDIPTIRKKLVEIEKRNSTRAIDNWGAYTAKVFDV